jgi:hypothetical protein
MPRINSKYKLSISCGVVDLNERPKRRTGFLLKESRDRDGWRLTVDVAVGDKKITRRTGSYIGRQILPVKLNLSVVYKKITKITRLAILTFITSLILCTGTNIFAEKLLEAKHAYLEFLKHHYNQSF